jgi:hypothetical protein
VQTAALVDASRWTASPACQENAPEASFPVLQSGVSCGDGPSTPASICAGRSSSTEVGSATADGRPRGKVGLTTAIAVQPSAVEVTTTEVSARSSSEDKSSESTARTVAITVSGSDPRILVSNGLHSRPGSVPLSQRRAPGHNPPDSSASSAAASEEFSVIGNGPASNAPAPRLPRAAFQLMNGGSSLR